MERVPFVKEGMRKGHLFYRDLNRNIWIFIHNILPVICRFTEFSSIQSSFLNLVYIHFFILSFSIVFFFSFLFLTFDNDGMKSSKHQVDLLLIYPPAWFILLCPRLFLSFFMPSVSNAISRLSMTYQGRIKWSPAVLNSFI